MPDQPQRAVLLCVRLPEVEAKEFESSRLELKRLVTTLGYEVVAEVIQQRAALSVATVVGEGKLQELATLTGGTGDVAAKIPRRVSKAERRRTSEAAANEAEAVITDDDAGDDEGYEFDDVDGADDLGGEALDQPPGAQVAHSEGPRIDLVAVDHDLSPTQLRNLERATGTDVLDRTGVIIEIFHRHAQSPKARLEVEIARLTYAAPRVRESPRGKERQAGRGAGEAAIELDRRRIRDRMAELKKQVEAIQREEGVRRAHRRDARRVALVGYTNAGKSSWMRVLTGSQVLVQDKLFATLDTTVRALHPETHPRILISDTVGFIKKLPHDLVASFKSTLDEALEASLLLYVVDAADPDWESQLELTQSVLSEIGAGELPARVLLNKMDCLPEAARADLAHRFPDALQVSARNEADVAEVRRALIAFFEASYVKATLVVPYDRQRLVSEMHESGRVLAEVYENDGVYLEILTDPQTLERLRADLAR
jgi:GTP-binding protein HflX